MNNFRNNLINKTTVTCHINLNSHLRTLVDSFEKETTVPFPPDPASTVRITYIRMYDPLILCVVEGAVEMAITKTVKEKKKLHRFSGMARACQAPPSPGRPTLS